jgi:hypothetical protein
MAGILSHEQKSLIEIIADDMANLSIDNLHEIIPQLMLQANLYKTLNIEQKKKLIIKMLEHLIDITDSPGDDELWDPILKRLLPGMLDLIIEANNGKLVIRKINKKNKFSWLCC